MQAQEGALDRRRRRTVPARSGHHGGTGGDEPPYPCRQGRLSQPERRVGVHRRQVHHRVHSLHRTLHRVDVTQVPDQHVVSLIPERRDPLGIADQHPEGYPRGQARRQAAPEPAGGSGEECSHEGSPRIISQAMKVR